jgi:ubiquinol-cytochrome c reductase cytochrome c subunit
MRRWAVVLLLAGPALLAIGGAAIGGMASVRSGTTTLSAADVERGRELFVTSCASCHGAEGLGTSLGPSLAGVGAASASFQLTTGRMPLANVNTQPVRKPKAFTRREIDDLVAYVASLGPGPPIPNVNPAAGSISTGASLFQLNCAACHSAAGIGGALSYGNDAPNLHQATPQQVAEAIRTGPGQMPVFGPTTFDQHQLNSLVRYVLYLRHPDDPGGLSLGHVGPITEGAVALLVGIPLLLFVARRIEEAHERQR